MRSICASTCGSSDLNVQRRSELENEGLRQGLQQVHGRLKRNKALRGWGNGTLPCSMDMSIMPATDGIAGDA
jgi:hypothetical protein